MNGTAEGSSGMETAFSHDNNGVHHKGHYIMGKHSESKEILVDTPPNTARKPSKKERQLADKEAVFSHIGSLPEETANDHDDDDGDVRDKAPVLVESLW